MVINDNYPLRIKSKSGNVVVISEEDYNAMQETFYLLKSPKNSQILLDRINDFNKEEKFNINEF